jgi:hypothetical protein
MSKERIFYVSSDGDDANAGTNLECAWKTLEKVNSIEFKPGDTVCFRKGDVWRGQLVPRSGSENASITYTSYGEEKWKPQIIGSVSKWQEFEWILSGENIWRADGGSLEIGNVIFNYDQCGVKVWGKNELKCQGEFFYDNNSKELFIYSSDNPALLYSGIECAQERTVIDQTDKSYIIYDGLAFKYGGSHGIGGANTGNITIRNCDISFMGGADFYKDGIHKNRYGNGIDFCGNAHDIIVEKCNIYEIYDAALTNHNEGQPAVQKNITYKKNTIWKCEYSFEHWNGPEESKTLNILFENSYCKDAGNGWAHLQRTDRSGRHLNFLTSSASINKFTVKGNTFEDAAESLVYLDPNFKNIPSVEFNSNRFTQRGNPVYSIWLNKEYRYEDFKKLKKDLESNKCSPKEQKPLLIPRRFRKHT